MTASRLSPVDAAFLHIEDRSNRMQLAGLLVFDGDTPSFDEFRDTIARALPRLPHFRDRLERSMLGLARPNWVEDESFDLDYHLHHIALPAPGDHAQIVGLIDHMTADPIDLQRPLWEMALVENLSNGGFAIALKVHHSMVDGLSIIDIFAVLCHPDPHHRSPDVDTPPPPSPRSREAPPTSTSPSAGGVAIVRRLQRAARLAGQAPLTRFNSGPSSAVRRTEYLTVSLGTVHDIRHHYRTTVNNIVLAIVTGALHRYLDRHGELVDRLHAFVPVNRRPATARGTLGNQISMTYPALPVGEADPEKRITAVIAAVAASSNTHQADDTAALLHLTRFAPQPIAAAVNRAMQFESNIFNLTVTNVPGPPVPVYFLGRQLQLILGATPLTRKHALTIAVLSYKGGLTFSVTTDPRRVPDIAELMTDIHTEIDNLHNLVAAPANPHVTRNR